MSDGGTHYEILELPRDASAEQVKKRYRELARRYHPDLNPDRPDAQRLFIRVTQAYEVLSDPVRRAHYDLSLRDQARRQAAAQVPPPGARPPTDAPSPPQGRAAPGGGRGQGADARSRREAEQRRQTLSRLLEDAQQAYARGHLREALRLCQEALQHGRSGAAYELKGDILFRQRRFEEAVHSYTIAAQLQPNSGLIMGKLNRAAARIERARDVDLEGMAHRFHGVPAPSARMAYRLSVSSFGLAAVIFLMLWRPAGEDAALGLPLAPSWTLGHLCFMLLDGFLCGAILAASAWLRPIDQELFYQSFGSTRRSVPLGAVLALFGAIFLPLVLGVYVAISFVQQTVSLSVLGVIGAAAALTIGFAAAAPHAQMQLETLLLGGNVLFLSMLLGWFIGDLFRPAWAL